MYDNYSQNGHVNLTEWSLNHKNNFTRGFPKWLPTTATFAAITYSPLVRHKLLHLQKQGHLSGVLPKKHPVRCYFQFVSPTGMMDLPFPKDFTHAELDSWQVVVSGCTNSPHWDTRKSPFSPHLW